MSETRSDREEEPFEGVSIDLPFVSFRAGHGAWGWNVSFNEDDEYRRAKRRVRARLGFYRHLAMYAAVMVSLFVLDWLTGGGFWVQWPAGIWGAILVWQAFNVFVFPQIWSSETEERMIEEELRRQRGSS